MHRSYGYSELYDETYQNVENGDTSLSNLYQELDLEKYYSEKLHIKDGQKNILSNLTPGQHKTSIMRIYETHLVE
jgi:hypothetical protein